MKQSFEVELEKCYLEFLLNSDFHILFEGLMDVFSKNLKHESCIYTSLVCEHESSASLES